MTQPMIDNQSQPSSGLVSGRVSPVRPFHPIDTSAVMSTPFLRRCYQQVQPAVEALFGFPELWRLYDAARIGEPSPSEFADRLLRLLQIGLDFDEGEIQALRSQSGPLIVLSNHPFGGADSLALVRLLEVIRPGAWRMLSNQVICSIPEFNRCLIAVDPLSSKGESAQINRRGLVAAMRHLQDGGVLALFPAGRVSHQDPSTHVVADRPWTDHAVRLAAATGAGIAVLHIPGQNSATFLQVPPRWSRFRALMLCRELTRPARRSLSLRLATSIPHEEVKRMASRRRPGENLRAWCYLRDDVDVPRPVLSSSPEDLPQPVAPPSEPASITAAIGELTATHRVLSSTKYDVLLIQGSESALLLHELGRSREITFRAAGQGTGTPLDLAPEDQYYRHLLLWDRQAMRLAGAYRIGIVQDILKAHGSRGLYLDHVFKIHPAFYQKLGPAFELSRSFVMPDYQRDNQTLAALWKGLGHSTVRHGIRSLFGSVTISNDHHPASRAILVEHLRRNYADARDLCALIQARTPFVPATRHHELIASAHEHESLDTLASKILQLEGGKRGIPPLMRYYCSLGAKYLGFHVEAAFADALYCLLRVDLHALPATYQRRFLGISSAS